MSIRSALDARSVANAYLQWLPSFLRPFLRVSNDGGATCSFTLWPIRRPLLVLERSVERSADDCVLFHVVGGLLSAPVENARPRLEFRRVLEGRFALAAIFDFVPSLPWFIYTQSQARVHLGVMRAFARHLQNSAR